MKKKKKKKRSSILYEGIGVIMTNNVYEPMHFHAEKQIKFANRILLSFTSIHPVPFLKKNKKS